METGEQRQPKKSPGRPCKVIVRTFLPREGIVKSPSNANLPDPRCHNVIELLYESPMMFRKIIGLYKCMNANNLRIRFEETCVKIHSKDASGNSDIYTIIYGNRMNKYYASKVTEFGLGLTQVYKVLQTMHKEHSKIGWYTSAQYERQKIKIGLAEDEFEEDAVWDIDMGTVDPYGWEVEEELARESTYPIRFDLPTKKFKKKVNDFAALGGIMKIEKYGHGLLKLNQKFGEGGGEHSTTFKNPSKINLISYIDKTDIFSVSVYLDDIKPLAGSLVSDTIRIAASCNPDPDANDRVIFTALLDSDMQKKQPIYGTERCQIKVLTRVVKAERDINKSKK